MSEELPDDNIEEVEAEEVGAIESRETESAIKFRRLTNEEYEEAKILRQRDGLTIREISDKLGVSLNTLHRRFQRDDIKKNQHAHMVAEAVQRRLAQASANNSQEMISRSQMIKELALKGIEQGVKLAIKTQTDAIRKGDPISTIEKDQKAITNFLTNMEKAITLSSKIILDYEDVDAENLPVLEVKAMNDAEVEEIKNQQAETDEIMDDLDIFHDEDMAEEDQDDGVVEIDD